MSRQLRLPITIKQINYPDQDVVRVEFQDPLADWVLQLVLLRDGLVKKVQLTDAQGTFQLSVEKGCERGISQVHWGTKSARIQLCDEALEHLTGYFLRSVRDGIAEVDHIDIEAESVGGKSKEAYATFKILKARPPMSGDALKRLLDGK